MITVVAGLDTRAKNAFFFEQILKSHRELGRSVVVLVPEQFTLTMEQALIDHLNLDGLMGIEVTSLSRLVHRVAAMMVDPDRTPLNGLGRKMLIRKIMEEQGEALKVFRKSHNRLGLIDEFAHMLVTFQNEKITPMQLQAYRDTLKPDDVLGRKLEDILTVFSAYEAQIEAAYLDEGHRMRQFVQHMDKLPELDGADVYLYGFHGFSLQEIDMLAAVSGHVRRLVLMLHYRDEERETLFPFTHKTLEQLRRLGIPIEVETFEQPDDAPVRFAKYLNLHNKVTLSHDVVLFTGKSVYSECQYVAGEVYRLVTEERIPLNDIQVTLLDALEYRPILTRELSRFGIPYFADETSALLDLSVVQAILSLLRFHDRWFETGELFDYLKMTAGPEDRDGIDRLENHALAFGINHGRWKGPLRLPEMEALRKRWVQPLLENHDRLVRPMPVSEFADELIRVLDALGLKGHLDETQELLQKQGMESEMLRLTQVWNKFIEVIEQIREASSDKPMSLRERIGYLEMAFEEERIGTIPNLIDGLRIHVLERSVMMPCSVTFLMGMSEKNLPKVRSDAKVLSETEKERLGRFGIDLRNDGRLFREKEILDLFTVLAKTEQRVYLSHAASDLMGKTLESSYYLKRAEEILLEPVRLDDLTDEHVFLPQWRRHRAELEMNLLRRISTGRSGQPVTDVWKGHAAGLFAADPEAARRITERLSYTNLAQSLSVPVRDGQLTSSITRLETFAACPYAYFAAYDLKLEERARYQVTPLEIGNLYHVLLEDVVGRMIRGEAQIPVATMVQNMLEQDEFAMFLDSRRSTYLTERVVRLAEKIVANLLDFFENSEYKPTHVEAAFARQEQENGLRPIEVDLGGGAVMTIRGKIDRIDAYADSRSDTAYCNVIDYKTGAKSLELGRVLAGISFQLPVYLMAVRHSPEAFGATRAEVSGIFYYRIHDDLVPLDEGDPDVDQTGKWSMDGLVIDDSELLAAMDRALDERGGGKSEYLPFAFKKDGTLTQTTLALPPEGFRRMEETVRAQVETLGRGIAGGRIAIEPIRVKNETACRFCIYGNVCKFDVRFEENRYRDIDIMSNRDAKEFLSRPAEEETL